MNILPYIVIAINLLAFIQMGIDKWLATKGKDRISEVQLIAPTLFGGFPGILIGMLVFRHKTSKRSFQFKLLLATLLFGIGIYFICMR